MSQQFNPPSLENLASVDSATSDYGAEVTEIVGVVSFGGQGGWSKCKDYEVHCFEFAAWRRDTEPLHQTTLTILRPVSADGESFGDYPAGSMHRIRVLLATDQTRAVFAAHVASDVVDHELEAIGAELAKPVTIETERYGVLTLDRRINWFDGEVDWNGSVIALRIEPDHNLDPSQGLKVADELFSNSAAWSQKVNDFAVQEKLELAHDWQDDDTVPITAEEFLERMTLESISIMSDGSFDFWHDDGDLFYGHSIQISGSLREGLTDSDIPG